MTSLARPGLADRRRLEARATRDRDLLLEFLGRDRIFAAYAIADMDDLEFARTILLTDSLTIFAP